MTVLSVPIPSIIKRITRRLHHLVIFVCSSPGDVPDERLLAARVIDDLPRDPLLKGKITTEVVAWDQPGSATPMLATMTPQEAINQGMPLPADCDVVIVIFWSRMGTPLPPEYTKPGSGERYLSGTEWEYLNAVDSAHRSAKRGDKPSRPQVVVYRRTQKLLVSFDDPQFEAKKQQWERVEAFFGTFINPDGSIVRGYNPYTAPDDFRKLFEGHMKKLVAQLLEAPAPIVPSGKNRCAGAVVWLTVSRFACFHTGRSADLLWTRCRN
jgi:hypothetical protein